MPPASIKIKQLLQVCSRWLNKSYGPVGLFSIIGLYPLFFATHTHGSERKLPPAVAELVTKRCVSCHNSSTSEGGLDLSNNQGFRKGGESGPAFDQTQYAESLVIKRVAAGEMPPENPLAESEQKTLEEWVLNGAPWGEERLNHLETSSDSRAGFDWWSFQELAMPSAPEVQNNTWVVNEIDRFILDRLVRTGLSPAPRATPRELVRRLYFDLVGLPPPFEVVQKFESAPTQENWEKLIDELLDSQHYGERWTQHWLDLARFGESNGFEYNVPRDHAWHYRDWLIRAFNQDIPYPEFVRWQIAGDLLAPNSPDGAAAVGFLVAGPHNTVLGISDVMKQTVRHELLEELSGTTFQAFLGLTVNCARCHDHKFDPITTEEYYRVISSLSSVSHGDRVVRSEIEPEKRDEVFQQRAKLTSELRNTLRLRGSQFSDSENTGTFRLPPNLNRRDQTYRVKLKLAPTVWANVDQATDDGTGVTISLVDSEGKVIRQEHLAAQSWIDAGRQQLFESHEFEYVGSNDREIELRIEAATINGRFGGAVDDLEIFDNQGKRLLTESFDRAENLVHRGVQADTLKPVYWGATFLNWEVRGLNAFHLVEHAPGNFALQLYSGNKSLPLTNPTDIENDLLNQLTATEHNSEATLFSVLPLPPSTMHVMARGDVRQVGKPVAPGGLQLMRNLPADFALSENASDYDKRLSLANWIASEKNGLLFRVIVNRTWHYHFGQGLLSKTSDFGFNGGTPSHPELLEWLAFDFREHGSSLKRLHRQILASATYQQSSSRNDSTVERAKGLDQDNRLLWRQNPRRLDGESVRDSLLAVSGLLDETMFGPGYRDVEISMIGVAHYYEFREDLNPSTFRRTLYRWRPRGDRSPLLEAFDCPELSTTAPNRVLTTTATQALSLWNNRLVLHCSSILANKLTSNTALPDTASRIQELYRTVLGRDPSQQELQEATTFAEENGLELLCRVLLNSNETLFID